MRISDWSTDVCSSDLAEQDGEQDGAEARRDQPERQSGEVFPVAEVHLHRPKGRGVCGDIVVEADLDDGADIHAGAEEDDVAEGVVAHLAAHGVPGDRKRTRLNSSHYCASRKQYY